ncbi:MAG: PilX N-terminal, partial [Pseudomonadota bacterium]
MKNIPMTAFAKKATMRHSQRGVSLVIVLVMMIIIGITAATAMRSATSEQRATNNMRMATTASQYAEAALRFCENELK